MQRKTSEIFRKLPSAKSQYIVPAVALRSVTSKSGRGIYASSDHLFKSAIFGRDSLEVAEDLMDSHPKLVRNILLTLASLIGTKSNDSNEERPGKIVHEYRNIIVDGKHIDPTSLEIFRTLSHKWGGNETEMAYYGSIDATPHFLRVLREYTSHKHRHDILHEKVTLRNGTQVTAREVARRALHYILEELKTSRTGMLEFMKINPHGISNQVWKDSEEFYVHSNKQIANHDAPISSIEVQGLAYDALMAAADLELDDRQTLVQHAHTLRDATLETLWIEREHRFALGTDIDPDDNVRIIETSTANPAALLDSRIFDDINEEKKQRYIAAIVRQITGHDFLTDAGIRSRSLNESDVILFWDYHGSFVSWPKETYDIAKGLRRQGFPKLALELENRILNIYLKNRHYPEFVYVDEKGRVLNTSPATKHHGEIVFISGTNKPERIQAWTVSAVTAIINRRMRSKLKKPLYMPPIHQDTWQVALENLILSSIPKVRVYLNPLALSARYPSYKFKLHDKD